MLPWEDDLDSEPHIGFNRHATEPAPATLTLLERQQTDPKQKQLTSIQRSCVKEEETGSDTNDIFSDERQVSSEPESSDNNAEHPSVMNYGLSMPGVGSMPFGLDAGAWPMPPMAFGGYPGAMPNAGVDPSIWLAATAAMCDPNSAQTQQWGNVYTVMMRNLPNKVTQQQLLSEVNEAGFVYTYDFVYLPIDPDSNANRGYSFINFTSPGMALIFKMHFEGHKFANFHSHKVVSVVPATLQGFEANYAHYSSAYVKYRDPAARPLFLREPTNMKSHRVGGQNAESLIDVAAKQLRKQQQEALQQKQRALLATMSAHSVVAPPTPGAAVGGGPLKDDAKPRIAKFCHNCGAGTAEHFKFCQFCGSRVGADA